MKLLYFAWFRAKIGVGEEVLTPPPSVADIAGLIEWLRQRSPGHAEALADLRVVRVAVNQDYAGLDRAVGPDDEVAFFPPVTGGCAWRVRVPRTRAARRRPSEAGGPR